MTNYRIFLLSFVTVSWIVLSGLNQPVDSDSPATEHQKTATDLISVDAESSRKPPEETKANVKYNKAKPQKNKQKTTKALSADDGKLIERKELLNPLDLSVPFQGSENVDLKTEQQSPAPGGVIDIFATETKKKPRQLELDSGFLMSPEPQSEKRKSVDGAGISINLKP